MSLSFAPDFSHLSPGTPDTPMLDTLLATQIQTLRARLNFTPSAFIRAPVAMG